MERIENKREVTQTVTDISYKAIDGTMFSKEEECRRYEETAEAVLLSKVKEFQIKEIAGNDFFETNDEGIYRIVVPTKESHIDTLNQLWKLNGGAYKKDLFFSNEDLNNVIAIGIRFCSNDKIDWIWFWKVSNVIRSVTDGRYTVAENNTI